MPSLIETYFIRHNSFTPLLHRPTFDKNLAEGLHFQDEGFAIILLLVCALGSRASNDPRVFLKGYDDYHSAGWKWFEQASDSFHVITYNPRLYDLQIPCVSHENPFTISDTDHMPLLKLLAHYLHESSAPHASWPIVGVGLRFAVSLGAHRRKAYDAGPSVELEQMKRAFW